MPQRVACSGGMPRGGRGPFAQALLEARGVDDRTLVGAAADSCGLVVAVDAEGELPAGHIDEFYFDGQSAPLWRRCLMAEVHVHAQGLFSRWPSRARMQLHSTIPTR